ncbi:hypothetical protein HDE_10609 [Halotydeus destructor]|nr:hypothetical protein HDE_10609 [Halotydeus destructor]
MLLRILTTLALLTAINCKLTTEWKNEVPWEECKTKVTETVTDTVQYCIPYHVNGSSGCQSSKSCDIMLLTVTNHTKPEKEDNFDLYIYCRRSERGVNRTMYVTFSNSLDSHHDDENSQPMDALVVQVDVIWTKTTWYPKVSTFIRTLISNAHNAATTKSIDAKQGIGVNSVEFSAVPFNEGPNATIIGTKVNMASKLKIPRQFIRRDDLQLDLRQPFYIHMLVYEDKLVGILQNEHKISLVNQSHSGSDQTEQTEEVTQLPLTPSIGNAAASSRTPYLVVTIVIMLAVVALGVCGILFYSSRTNIPNPVYFESITRSGFQSTMTTNLDPEPKLTFPIKSKPKHVIQRKYSNQSLADSDMQPMID